METEIKNSVLFKFTPKKIKYLVINPRKYVQYIHVENQKMLRKTSVKAQIGTSLYCADGFEDNMLNMSVPSKFICRTNEIPMKSPARIFIDIDKLILKCI